MRWLRYTVVGLALLGLARGADAANAFANGDAFSFSLAPQAVEEEMGGTESETMVVEDNPELLWPGFLWGDRHFRHKPRPVTMPYYFEDPFINTDMRLIYVWHNVPEGSQLRGGEVQVWSAQIRVALTERLQFIATKDGYTKLQTGVTPDGDGWNDFAVGLKYAFWVDHDNDWIMAGGVRWEWDNGSLEVFQGNEHEISPFISFAKSWDKLNMIGAVNYRIPTETNQGNESLTWHLHFDYEVLPNFFPLVELNGIHWTNDSDRMPLSVEYLDVGSFGSSRVAGRDFFSCGLGFRWHMCEWASLGAAWEFPLESKNENIEDSRVTINLALTL